MKYDVPECKFSEGETVMLKTSPNGKKGIVRTAKQMFTVKNGVEDYDERYYVNWGNYTSWHDVNQLVPIYSFSNGFEMDLCRMMIDLNLDSGNFDFVKAHYEDMQKYKTK